MLSNIKSNNTSNWPKNNKLIDHFITGPILFHYFLHHEEHIVTFAYIRVLSQAHFVSSCDPAPRNASPEFSHFDVIKLDASQFWNTWYTLSYVEVSWQHEPLKKSVLSLHNITTRWWCVICGCCLTLAILVIYTGEGMYLLILQFSGTHHWQNWLSWPILSFPTCINVTLQLSYSTLSLLTDIHAN